MRQILSNILLAADADGTLLTDDKRILDKDKAAICEFCEQGGLFTIATGRGVAFARPVVEELSLAIPAVIFNGAAVYDYSRDCFLWQCTLPKAAKEYILLFKERFPTLGIEILRGREVYVASTNARVERHALLSGVPTRCSIQEVPPDGWIKTLLVDEPEIIDEVIKFAGSQNIESLHLVRSAPMFYEILPHGVNKGSALSKLIELTGISGRRVAAVGDFMNDLEMIQMADIKIAVANAEEIVKSHAELIVCDNNSGALYEIVEWMKLNAKKIGLTP